ncbi:expressed unknown protein [Seminavis robusta]|uniref:Uncharacterized protein n=1 Tax=Seminavis robusta TaxID=568900 RepID=A0A9N8HUX8_9STRA|nr:expressed unknown protein [Seminavis robusta]|eukprot:Sro1896_g304040.1 n/a (371) ;mRNA; r:8479-9591
MIRQRSYMYCVGSISVVVCLLWTLSLADGATSGLEWRALRSQHNDNKDTNNIRNAKETATRHGLSEPCAGHEDCASGLFCELALVSKFQWEGTCQEILGEVILTMEALDLIQIEDDSDSSEETEEDMDPIFTTMNMTNMTNGSTGSLLMVVMANNNTTINATGEEITDQLINETATHLNNLLDSVLNDLIAFSQDTNATNHTDSASNNSTHQKGKAQSLSKAGDTEEAAQDTTEDTKIVARDGTETTNGVTVNLMNKRSPLAFGTSTTSNSQEGENLSSSKKDEDADATNESTKVTTKQEEETSIGDPSSDATKRKPFTFGSSSDVGSDEEDPGADEELKANTDPDEDTAADNVDSSDSSSSDSDSSDEE